MTIISVSSSTLPVSSANSTERLAPSRMTPPSMKDVKKVLAMGLQANLWGFFCPCVCTLVLVCGEGAGGGSGSLTGSNCFGIANPTDDPCLESQRPEDSPALYCSSATNGFLGGTTGGAYIASCVGQSTALQAAEAIVVPASIAYGATGVLCCSIGLSSLAYNIFCSDSSTRRPDQTHRTLHENNVAAPANNIIERSSPERPSPVSDSSIEVDIKSHHGNDQSDSSTIVTHREFSGYI